MAAHIHQIEPLLPNILSSLPQSRRNTNRVETVLFKHLYRDKSTVFFVAPDFHIIQIMNVYHGKRFEALIAHSARMQGLLLVSHGTKAIYLRGGETQCIKSDVDFRLTNKKGQTVYFDAKSFQGSYATKSQFTAHQLQRLASYEQYNLVAGFLVQLREIDSVFFINAQSIASALPGSRFNASSGFIIEQSGALNLMNFFK